MLRFKVGFVAVLSCLALMVGLFSSSGVASAHKTQAVHSQTSVTSLSTLTDDQRCNRVYVMPGHSYHGKHYSRGGYVTACGRYNYYNSYYGGYSGCSRVYAPIGNFHGIFYSSAGYVTVCRHLGYYSGCRRVFVPSGFYSSIYYQYSDYIVVCH